MKNPENMARIREHYKAEVKVALSMLSAAYADAITDAVNSGEIDNDELREYFGEATMEAQNEFYKDLEDYTEEAEEAKDV